MNACWVYSVENIIVVCNQLIYVGFDDREGISVLHLITNTLLSYFLCLSVSGGCIVIFSQLLYIYPEKESLVIGIDQDTVCVVAVGTAIRNSTSCAGRCAAACGRAGRHNECCSGLQYQPRQRRPYKWSISILPRSQFTKSKGNLRFRCLVPLFVPIGVCVTTHDDGTASDVTIGMWRHNQQVTNHERSFHSQSSLAM